MELAKLSLYIETVWVHLSPPTPMIKTCADGEEILVIYVEKI